MGEGFAGGEPAAGEVGEPAFKRSLKDCSQGAVTGIDHFKGCDSDIIFGFGGLHRYITVCFRRLGGEVCRVFGIVQGQLVSVLGRFHGNIIDIPRILQSDICRILGCVQC